ncbi:MAG: hypothetical protein NW226_11575 [Microscillaceae bacterium]|nr:hypothetical protein [Microscillaceae bacterium]
MKIFKKLIFLSLFLLQMHNLSAQKKLLFSRDYWHKGSATLKSGQTLAGLIKYHLDENVILIQGYDQKITAYSSAQINNFYIWDTLTRVQRNFFTLRTRDAAQSSYNFYELLFQGQVSLLSREKTAFTPIKDPTQPKLVNQNEWSFKEDYFLLNAQGKIKTYHKLDTLGDVLRVEKKELQEFIQENDLNLESRKDFVFLIDHYNEVLSLRESKNREQNQKN